MKSLTLPVLVLFALMPAGLYPAAQEKSTSQENRAKNVPPDLVDQIDTTDIYAVPFDTSEEEEDVSEQNLEKLQKKLQQEKANSSKTQPASGKPAK